MNKYKIIYYYLLVLIGLIVISWIIWARFLRQRIIREIPDGLFTEYRFWLLLYFCCICLYIIKNIIKPKENNIFLTTIIEYFYTPLDYLDKHIKYFVLGKEKYLSFSRKMITFLCNRSAMENYIIILVLSIIPRLVLALFLFTDTFYFYKLEIFYKVILIGLLPFFFRYFKYSVRKSYDFWVQELERHYAKVLVFRKGFEYVDFNKDFDADDEDQRFERMDRYLNIITSKNNEAIYHYKEMTIKEYIELKFKSDYRYLIGETNYEYIGNPRAYLYQNENEYDTNDTFILNMIDCTPVHKLFHELIPQIMNIKFYLYSDIFKDNLGFKILRIITFSIYFICWSFILIISYYVYPVQFTIFKTFITGFSVYLFVLSDVIETFNVHSSYNNISRTTIFMELYNKIVDKLLRQ